MVRSEEPPSVAVAHGIARTPAPVYVAVIAPVVIAVIAAATQPWLRPTDLVRDSQAVAVAHGDANTAYGLLSNLGIVAIAIASGAALVGWLATRGRGEALGAMLGWSAALGLVLALDDLLLLHETATLTPWAGATFVAAYGVGFLVYLARFQEVIRERLDPGLLLLAMAAFGGSAMVDLLLSPTQASVLVEDGTKLLGIAAWSAFVVRASLTALVEPAPSPTEARAAATTALQSSP
ncbi:hypothetical protein ACFPER_02630 [Agromyces aurantiacus]|uniref:DUF998 domain-containing protein n=1 Tax=Agromyces aurantiacus TaxID=165814 RepID=A0ABV9R5N7_9MICO|nr:hypothetical protein [Agromyces aurantiacus]MBM7505984.1 hypothetical protein [Agromyces aurantiacus]